MKRNDHLMFFLTMVFMFIAPRVSASIFGIGGPSKSTISLALAPLLVWAVLNPSRLIQYPQNAGRLPLFIIWFSGFSILSTLLTGNLGNLVNALQYFLYAYLGVMLLSHYLQAAISSDQLQTAIKMALFVAVPCALGVVVSVWTGPFYPHQVLEIGRHWQGVLLMQGVGFGVNANSVSGVLSWFNVLTISLYEASGGKRAAVIGLLTCALFLTISRAGIGSFFLGMLAVMAFIFLDIVINRRMSKGYFDRLIMLGAMFFCVVIGVALFALYKPTLGSSIAEGFGLGGTSIVGSESGRISAWQRGIDKWVDSPLFEAVKGYGFRGSSSIMENYIETSHNFFVSVLGDFGIIGLALFVISYVWLLFKAIGLLMSSDKIGIFGTWSLVALLLQNMTETFFYGIEYVFILTVTAVLLSVQAGLKTAPPIARGV